MHDDKPSGSNQVKSRIDQIIQVSLYPHTSDFNVSVLIIGAGGEVGARP